MHDLSRWRFFLEARVKALMLLESVKPMGVRKWKAGGDHIRVGVLGECVYAYEVHRKVKPLPDCGMGDGGFDFDIDGQFLDVKSHPRPYGDWLHPDGDPLDCDWWAVCRVDWDSMCGEVVGCVTQEMALAAKPAPEHYKMAHPCRMIFERDLLPVPEWMYMKKGATNVASSSGRQAD